MNTANHDRTPRLMRLINFILICGVAACADFPSIDTPLADDTAFPQLVPLGPILGQATGQSQATDTTRDTLNGRIAALNARAARLRGPVIAQATQARMVRGIAVGPLR